MKRIVASVLSAFAAVMIGSPSVGAQSIGYAVDPVPTPGELRSYLQVTAAAGEAVTDGLVVRNLSAEPISVRMAAVEAATGPLGGASYASADAAPSATARWVSVSPTEISLAAHEHQRVDVQVSVPPGARPGDHLAGIAIWQPEPARVASADTPRGLSAAIDVTTRRVVAVHVVVPGPTESEIVLRGVSVAARPGGLHLMVGMDNSGSKLVKGEGTIDLGHFSRTFAVDTFVPGTSIEYPVPWAITAAPGRYPATVTLRYDDRVATWEGDVVVDDRSVDELQRRAVEPLAAQPPPATEQRPWALIGAIVVAAALLARPILGLVRSR